MRREQHGLGDSWHAELGSVDGYANAMLAQEWQLRHDAVGLASHDVARDRDGTQRPIGGMTVLLPPMADRRVVNRPHDRLDHAAFGSRRWHIMVLMFVDQRQFPFLADLRARWESIRDECLALPRDTYQPWVQREMYGQGWSVYGLVAFGRRIEEALEACPNTAAALTTIPHLTTAGFSRMAPGTHINPHQGWVTTVYRAHLGLVVPQDCALRVGDQTRRWHEGKTFVFDDTVTHEAWNYGPSDRVVLLFDFARPGYEDVPQDELPPSVAGFVQRGG